MLCVTPGLELEGGVLDVEVSGQALPELVQHAGQVSVMEAEVATTTCAVSTGRPVATLARVQVVFGEHVTGVGKQRQASGEGCANDLNDQDGRRDGQTINNRRR